jgi:uncharacterized protein YraI
MRCTRNSLAGLICWILWVHPGLSAEEPGFPYTARIDVDNIAVYAGPADHYYTTQLLERGETIEVHRHDDVEWLAIRPPSGSFSWVAARHLKQEENSPVAEVISNKAVAWIGSQSSAVTQYKWQVQLDRGERVKVLGRAAIRIGPGTAAETFVKIAPPSGEFRWIRSQQSSMVLHKAPRDSNPKIQLADFQSATDPSRVSKDLRSLDQTELAKRVDQLRVDLSLLVTRSVDTWNLAEIENRFQQLRQAANDAELAEELATISQRLQDIRQLQQRYQALLEGEATPDSRSDQSTRGVSAAPRGLKDIWTGIELFPIGTGVEPAAGPNRISQVAAANELPSPTDAIGISASESEGWLVPVHSAKRIAPPFALLDDEGRVLCYVQPAPGLNLRRYARKQVRLIGSKRTVPALRASLITAERVVKIKPQSEE